MRESQLHLEQRGYTMPEQEALYRLDKVASLKHNLEQLSKVGIHEKRVFLHSLDDPIVEKEHRIPITPDLMMGLSRCYWGLQAQALNLGLQQETIDITSKYLPKDD